MLSFFQKKTKLETTVRYADLVVDFHSHWLPGVDDGCQMIEESKEILNKFVDLGYTKVYTSPHIMGEGYTNTKANLLERFHEFSKGENIKTIPIQLGIIAEYLLDESFEDLLKNNEFLTLGDNHILVETSMHYDLPFVRDYLYELVSKGYQPILAHPERYRYLHSEKNYIDKYEEILDWGVEFQLNMFSLVGMYGHTAQHIAEQLIDRGHYSYVCTDIHSPNQINFFLQCEKSIYLNRIIQSGKLKNNLFL